MAIASLRFDANSAIQETKGGVFVYDGNASRFHEWEFRTTMRALSSKEEDLPRTANSIVESLRGEAALVAMDIGIEKLLKSDGIRILVEKMRTHVFPQARTEAKELYKMGHKTQGILARQPSESMSNYVIRRRRWWKQLKEMDPAVSLSQEILGDLMLEASGISQNEQLMVLTSIGNAREFDKLAVALMEQHPRIQSSEKAKDRHVPQQHGGHRPYKGGGKSRGKGWSRFGHMGFDEYDDPEPEEDAEPEEDDEA
jgi:hypothetical protein